MLLEISTIDVQISELEQAGWKRYRGRFHMWISPTGAIYLGPHGAWKVMKAGQDAHV